MAYRGRGGHPIYVGCLFTFWAAQHYGLRTWYSRRSYHR